MAAATLPSLPMLPKVPVAFGFDTLSVGLILESLQDQSWSCYFSKLRQGQVNSPYDLHGHTQLPGDHLGHLGVHPLTHLDPTVGNGYASVVVVDGYVHRVPEEKESCKSIFLSRVLVPGAKLIVRILKWHQRNPSLPPQVPLVEVLHVPLPQLKLGRVFQPGQHLLQGGVIHLKKSLHYKTGEINC